MAGFAFLFGSALGAIWWTMRKDQLGKSIATIDCYEGIVTGPEGVTEKIRRCRLAACYQQAQQAENGTRPACWTLKAIADERKPVSILLLETDNQRDAEIVRAELLPYGFDRLETGPGTPSPNTDSQVSSSRSWGS